MIKRIEIMVGSVFTQNQAVIVKVEYNWEVFDIQHFVLANIITLLHIIKGLNKLLVPIG